MAPARRHAPPAAWLLLLAIGSCCCCALAAADAPSSSSSPSSSSASPSFFFGHLPRTRYPPQAQSWRATPPGAPVFAHLARGDVETAAAAAAAAATSSNANDNDNDNNSNKDAPPAVPGAFSWCDVGGANLCAASWQQHNAAMPPAYCGSCFLHATLSALQDRIKGQRHLQSALGRHAAAPSQNAAASLPNAAAASASSQSAAPVSAGSNLQDVMLGRQAFLNCAPLHGLSKGCDGGEPLDVYHYMARFGLPDEACVPYSATDHTRFQKKKGKGKRGKKPATSGQEEEEEEEAALEHTSKEEEDDEAVTPLSDAAATAAEALRAARGQDEDKNANNVGGSAAEYLLRGDPKCRGPKRGQRQCMNCMPLPDDPEKKKKKKPDGDDDDDGDQDPIPAECWAVARPVRYGVKAFGKVPAGEESMQREIMARGPIVCGIACPESFVYGYKGGVFVDDGADKELDHDVELVGWGEEEGTDEQGNSVTRKYWLVRNSWGTYWGQLGFFKLERGANALQVESGEDGSGDCWFAEPDLAFENDVAAGQGWEGSMYGLRPRKESGQRVRVRAEDAGAGAGAGAGATGGMGGGGNSGSAPAVRAIDEELVVAS
jgi:hypothetical protein